MPTVVSHGCVENKYLLGLSKFDNREQIFARENHHLLGQDYSKNHDILSISHVVIWILEPFFSIFTTQNS